MGMLYLDDSRTKYYIDWTNLHHESFFYANAYAGLSAVIASLPDLFWVLASESFSKRSGLSLQA